MRKSHFFLNVITDILCDIIMHFSTKIIFFINNSTVKIFKLNPKSKTNNSEIILIACTIMHAFAILMNRAVIYIDTLLRVRAMK